MNCKIRKIGHNHSIRQLSNAHYARALMAHTELNPAEICREAMEIAGSLCVYTNQEIVVEEL